MPRHVYTDKPRLTKEDVRRHLLKFYADGVTKPLNIWKQLNEKYAISRVTVERNHAAVYAQWSSEVETKIIEETTNPEALALRRRLKTKTERALEIQNMLDTNLYRETIYDFKRGAPVSYTRELTPLERKALYDRLAKMEGDDVPLKVAQTDTDGNTIRRQVIKLPNGVEIDIS